MTPNLDTTNRLNPLLPWMSLGMKLTEMVWASSPVNTQRARAILPAHPDHSAEDRRDLRMIEPEKIQAAYASAIAMSANLGKLNVEFGTLALKQWIATATSWTAYVLRRPSAAQSRDLTQETASAAKEISITATRIEKPRSAPVSVRGTKVAKRMGKAKPARNGKHLRRAK